jgi:hypothetical protein
MIKRCFVFSVWFFILTLPEHNDSCHLGIWWGSFILVVSVLFKNDKLAQSAVTPGLELFEYVQVYRHFQISISSTNLNEVKLKSNYMLILTSLDVRLRLWRRWRCVVVMVFWVATPCRFVGRQRFSETLSVVLNTEDWGGIFLGIVVCNYATTQKTNMHVVCLNFTILHARKVCIEDWSKQSLL